MECGVDTQVMKGMLEVEGGEVGLRICPIATIPASSLP